MRVGKQKSIDEGQVGQSVAGADERNFTCENARWFYGRKRHASGSDQRKLPGEDVALSCQADWNSGNR
jgi:hypothetical protein